MRSKTQEVELNGFKISAVEEGNEIQNVIFLHGLLGQGKNWRSFALNDIISAHRNVFLVDLRNHGESDHHSSMTYKEMADDVVRFADSRGLQSFSLLGHNFGAKIAMNLTCRYQDRVKGFVSIDTAPKSFIKDKQIVQGTYESIKKIRNLDIEGKTRKTALEVIQQQFKDPGITNLIASNLVYDEQSERKYVKWSVNLDAILKNYENIIGFDEEGLSSFKGPCMFLNGGLSLQHNEDVYTKFFPYAQIERIEGAGHYVHTDKPKLATEKIARFLKSLEI